MDTSLNAPRAVSNTFSQHIVKFSHRANRAFISQPLLPTWGPWGDPGKKEDLGNLSSGRRGFQLLVWKKLSVKADLVFSQAPLPSPAPHPHTLSCTFLPDLLAKGSSGEISKVRVSGSGTAFGMEWTRCSQAEDCWCSTPAALSSFSKCMGRSSSHVPKTALSSSRDHLRWKSMLQPNQLLSLILAFGAIFSSFLQWNLLFLSAFCSPPPALLVQLFLGWSWWSGSQLSLG